MFYPFDYRDCNFSFKFGAIKVLVCNGLTICPKTPTFDVIDPVSFKCM